MIPKTAILMPKPNLVWCIESRGRSPGVETIYATERAAQAALTEQGYKPDPNHMSAGELWRHPEGKELLLEAWVVHPGANDGGTE